jgi:hypothetical protein
MRSNMRSAKNKAPGIYRRDVSDVQKREQAF